MCSSQFLPDVNSCSTKAAASRRNVKSMAWELFLYCSIVRSNKYVCTMRLLYPSWCSCRTWWKRSPRKTGIKSPPTRKRPKCDLGCVRGWLVAAEEGQKNDLDLYFLLLLGVNNEDQQCAIIERKAPRPPWQCCTFAWIHISLILFISQKLLFISQILDSLEWHHCHQHQPSSSTIIFIWWPWAEIFFINLS